MSTESIFYIILAGIAALLIALFQYIYKSNKSKLNSVFAFLRFITVFLILLLLINPKFTKKTVYTEKPNLIVAIDNSESINHLKHSENAINIKNKITQNQELNNKFDINYYTFGSSFKPLDSLSFTEKQTNISSILKGLNQIYKNKIAPTVILTDGNQTYGTDYEYSSRTFNNEIYPIILGDTLVRSDLKIQHLNVNKYVFLKNKFTAEVLALYSGNSNVKSKIQISSGNRIIFSKNIEFTSENNSHKVNVEIEAQKVGVHVYKATILPLDIEENKNNNTKQFAIEVIDEKTNIALISDIMHPDLGALKKAIETNKQRNVSILKPSEFLNSNQVFQLAILYQPNALFNDVFDRIKAIGINKLVITGTQTQWTYLNQIQSHYKQEITEQSEDYQPSLNSGYNTFNVEEFSFHNYPPLTSEFGKIEFNIPYETIFFKKVNSSIIDDPLLVTFELDKKREALLTGEGLWRWRAQSYLDNESYDNFDNFVGKLIQYLASNKRNSRLVIDYNSFYQGNENIIINAQYFDKNYEFDKDANIEIVLENSTDNSQLKLPLIQNNSSFSVTLKDLKPGNYNFTVFANTNEFKRSGSFTLLDFNVEKQFLNADVLKLEEIAKITSGKSVFYQDTDTLIQHLLNDNKYQTIQKSTKKIVPLVDFKILLFLIALSLAIEWFLRKYNGLI